MNHAHERASLVLVGSVFLLMTLITLFLLEPDLSGKATAATSVNITNSTPANCTANVGVGRSTVSWSCITTAEARANVVNDANLVAMYQYIPGAGDPWKVHNPNLPGYVVSDLTFLSRRVGYVMIMSAPDVHTFEGFRTFSTTVPLEQGWSLVGYPAFSTRNSSTSFLNIDNYTEARVYVADTLLSYLNPGGGTLTETIPGQGYWINATQATTWVVPS